MIKDDMIQAISKYMEIDTDGLEIKITADGRARDLRTSVRSLYASIPIRDLQHRRGTFL